MKIPSLLALLALISFSGCGPSSDVAPNSEKSKAVAPKASLPSVVTVDGVTTVHIAGNDRMQFTLTEFTVTAGDTVHIVFVNEGRMPKTAMGHNVVVLKEGVDANAYAGKAALARDTDFIPASEADSVIAHTMLLGPDETDTIEFIAPAAGEYAYICSFPAHCFAGMRGMMTVVAE